jgi:hypothetical protein
MFLVASASLCPIWLATCMSVTPPGEERRIATQFRSCLRSYAVHAEPPTGGQGVDVARVERLQDPADSGLVRWL